MKLPFPTGGVSDNFAFEQQPPATSVEAFNVRSVDKVTGRVRGAQRAGLGRLSDARLGSGGKVQALAVLTSDQRQTTSSERQDAGADSLTDWSETVTGARECRGAAIDFQGNVFALNGASAITKFNSEGVKLFDFSFPIEDDSHEVQTLTLDEFGVVYVAVTTGDPAKADLAWARAFVADDERGLVMLWEFKPGGYVDRITLKDDKAFLAVNTPDIGRSKIIVLELIDTVAPNKAQEWPVSFPIRSVAVDQNSGDVYTAHAPNSLRSIDPRFQDLSEVIDDIPDPSKFLVDFEKRCYAWLRADKIKEQFGFENIADGDEVTIWEDVGPRKRAHMRKDASGAATDVGVIAPRFVSSGVAGKPGVLFTPDSRLQSSRSIGSLKSLNDGQPLLIPNRTSYVMFVVFRVDGAAKGAVLWQHCDKPSGGVNRFDDDALLSVNAEEGSTANQQLATEADRVYYRPPGVIPVSGVVTGLDENDPTDDTLPKGQHNNRNGVVIFTMVDVVPGEFASDRCFMRTNGTPTCKFPRPAAGDFSHGCITSVQGSGLPTFKGRSVFGSVETQISGLEFEGQLAGFEGLILEVLTFRAYIDDSGALKLMTCPNYNGNADGGVVSQPAYVPTSNTEVEQIERYLAYKYGVSHLLDDGSEAASPFPQVLWDSEGGHTQYTHAYCRESGPGGIGLGQDVLNVIHQSVDPILIKWRSRGLDPVWAASVSGIGYEVALDGNGGALNIGPVISGGTQADSITVRRILDTGDSFTLDTTFEHFETESGFVDYTNERPRMAVDRFGNVWIPGHWDMTNGPALLVFDDQGDVVLRYFLGSQQQAFTASVDPRVIDYTGNINTISLPETALLATDAGLVTTSDTVHHLDMIEAEGAVGSPRAVVWLGVCGGDIVKFTDGPVVSITGGTGALSSTASTVIAVPAFSEVYFTDGVDYRKYNPKTDAIERWISSGSGEIPKSCRLMAFWRGRMVLARSPDDPFNWHMSASGDPDDWNQFPAVNTATQAISGNNAEIGLVPDIVNALIPYDRERLIFGGDHSIHVMWGDPMEGGSIVLLSDVTGIAFGSAWCKDSMGVLYFFGSRGGVYAMTPGEVPVKISSQTIDRRLQDINLETHTVALAWDDDEQQLILCQIPYGAGGTILDRYVWEKKANAWWPDRSTAATVQPTAVLVLDGDEPEDRLVVFGCEDGFVRDLSRTATTDDGQPIDSYVTIGPIYDPSGAVRLRNPKVTLARDQGGCWVELFSSDTPDVIGDVQAAALLNSGQNPKHMIGVRGAYVWLRLRNAAAGQSWAVECIYADTFPAGRKVAP